MAQDIKKYLDLAGLEVVWEAVKAEDLKEKQAREAADQTLETKIDEAKQGIEDEALAREQSVQEVQSKLETEVLRAQSAESGLQTAISAETTARLAAEKDLGDRISGEANRAVEVEGRLQDAIDAINHEETGILAQAKGHVAEEVEALDEVIGNLQAAVEAHNGEFETRVGNLENADRELQSAIDAKVAKDVYDAKVTELEGKVVTGVADAKKHAEDKIAELVGGAPEALDTLKELADALDKNEGMLEALGTATDKKIEDAKNDLQGKIDGLHKAQVYNIPVGGAVADTTCIEEAVASLTGVKFGGGDVIVITDALGVSAAYQFDDNNGEGGAWEALTGNVSANNVIMKENITMAGNYTTVGNLSKSQNGTATFATAGKSVTEAFMEIFSKRLQPTKSEPVASFSKNITKSVEVGTTVTPSYTVALSTGSYTYGPATGITAKSWSVVDTKGRTLTTATGSFEGFVVGDGENYSITATASYDAGVVAKDNLGAESNPKVQIAAGSKSVKSGAITGYRNMFMGSSVDVKEITSANIRGLATKVAQKAVTDQVVTVVEGAKQVIIAVPNARTLKSVKDVGAFGTDIVGSFVQQSANVEGANGYAAAGYKVYVYQPAAALGANTYKVTIG